jgi:hypothetical protein
MESNEILTLRELVDLYDEGKLEGEHFIFYPTAHHKEIDSRGYIPRTEIQAYSEFRKMYEKQLFKALWKNG